MPGSELQQTCRLTAIGLHAPLNPCSVIAGLGSRGANQSVISIRRFRHTSDEALRCGSPLNSEWKRACVRVSSTLPGKADSYFVEGGRARRDHATRFGSPIPHSLKGRKRSAKGGLRKGRHFLFCPALPHTVAAVKILEACNSRRRGEKIQESESPSVVPAPTPFGPPELLSLYSHFQCELHALAAILIRPNSDFASECRGLRPSETALAAATTTWSGSQKASSSTRGRPGLRTSGACGHEVNVTPSTAEPSSGTREPGRQASRIPTKGHIFVCYTTKPTERARKSPDRSETINLLYLAPLTRALAGPVSVRSATRAGRNSVCAYSTRLRDERFENRGFDPRPLPTLSVACSKRSRAGLGTQQLRPRPACHTLRG